MAFISVLAILALVVSAEGSVGPSTNNSFCTESKECLEYELVCKTDEYEVRHYSPTRWVSTDAEAYFMGVGAAMAFRRLFQYITGANEGGIQMEMTAPVLVKIPEETKMWEPAVYTLNFPLPAAYQDKPPTPTNDKLYFTEMPAMDVYVRRYGGWMLSVTSRLHAHLLTKELERVRANYNCTYHYGVGYDSPLKLLNRHNEVWYVSEGEPVCTDPKEPTPAHTPRASPTDLPTDGPSDAPADSQADAPSDTQADAPSDSQADAPSDIQADAPSDIQADAPSDIQADAPSDFQADAPSQPLALALSDAPALPLSNTSSNATFNSSSSPSSSSSSQPPSDTPTPSATSDSPPGPSSSLPADAAVSHPPTSAHILPDPTANSTDPASPSPSLEPQADSALWNSTAHGAVTSQADSYAPAVEPDDGH